MSFQALDIASTGLYAFGENISVVGNNVANVNTNAFKRSDIRFQDVLYQRLDVSGKPTTGFATGIGKQIGAGVQIASIPSIFQQGPLRPGLDLDIAIAGQGFFRVVDVDSGETFYTRLGSFQPKGVGSAGTINLQLGDRVLALDPPITLPGNNAVTTVDEFGVLRQGDFQAQIELTRFQNPDGLLQVGDLLFEATAATGQILTGTPGVNGFGSIANQTLEGSNVELTDQLLNLILASQGFTYNSQVFVTGNQEIQQAIALAQQT